MNGDLWVGWFKLPGSRWQAVVEGTRTDCKDRLEEQAARYRWCETVTLPEGQHHVGQEARTPLLDVMECGVNGQPQSA